MDIGMAMASFKVLLESAKLVRDLSDATARNAAVIELQGKILGMQGDYLDMVARLAEAQAKLQEAEGWTTEAARYELKDYGDNTFAYELKIDKANGEPAHRLCSPCFNEGKKAILHFSHRSGDQQDYYDCPRCKTKTPFGKIVRKTMPQHMRSGDWRA